MAVEITIVCDGCATIMAGGKTARGARDSIRHLPVKTGLPGGRDLCVRCVTDGGIDG